VIILLFLYSIGVTKYAKSTNVKHYVFREKIKVSKH